jgi:hypothetical protein
MIEKRIGGIIVMDSQFHTANILFLFEHAPRRSSVLLKNTPRGSFVLFKDTPRGSSLFTFEKHNEDPPFHSRHTAQGTSDHVVDIPQGTSVV